MSLRRVDPNAASRARRNVRCFACSKNSMSLRVRARPAALDVVHAEGVEPLGDAQLVGDREGDAFALGAVAQGRVVDLDHGVIHGTDGTSDRQRRTAQRARESASA